ncbi:MAG: dipeptidase [Chloroflexota bacterium]
MENKLKSAIAYARQNQTGNLDNLKEFVAIPSISTDPVHKPDILSAAAWLVDRLTKIGVRTTRIMPTEGHPVVYGETDNLPGRPTILIYGHYDVQPVDPIELWDSGPFDPTVKEDYLFGRGTSDMKGQVMAVLSALEAINSTGSYPVNLKFMFEGEEEIGSPSLEKWIIDNRKLLKADICLNTDAGMIGKDAPTLTYGLRGLVYFELHVTGPDHDLHSGLAGGMVHNPAQALAELISKMHDETGRISLPGFYDSVRPIDPQERLDLARLPHTDEEFLAQTGVPMLWGESQFTPIERTGARPTLEINGMLSGFTGSGQKTVIPAWAMAKISCRLVPDQDPGDVFLQLKKFIEKNAPPTIRWDLKKLSGARASISKTDQPGVLAMRDALKEVWGIEPFLRREGGSIPVVGQMQTILGMESILTGFGLPDDNLHAPNEKMHLPTWYRGIESLIHFFFNL